MSRLGVIEGTAPEKCELCGKEEECRPYGPKGESICFACGMKNDAVTALQFSRVVLGEPVQ